MSDRPLIAVDCDGVLYCWDRTARYMLREKHKREGRDYPAALDSPSTHWHAIQEAVDPEMWDWLWTDGVEQGLFRHGDVMSGAIFGALALHEFADLMIVTSRPQQGVHDTMAWLGLHLDRVPLVGIDILSHGQPKSSVRPMPDMLIDDGLHNMRDWLNNTDSRFILFDQPWNRDGVMPFGTSDRARRGRGWQDVVSQARALLASEGDSETAWSESVRPVPNRDDLDSSMSREIDSLLRREVL